MRKLLLLLLLFIYIIIDPTIANPQLSRQTPRPSASIPVVPTQVSGSGQLKATKNIFVGPKTCTIDTSNRIVGGNVTNIDDYPWMALIQYTKPGNRKGYHCGGALINSRYVLTAAHCVTGTPPDYLINGVRLGEYDLSTEIDCDGDDCNDSPVDVVIEEIIPHPNYNPQSKNQVHDIALIRLAENVQFTSWIKPACLPLDKSLDNVDINNLAVEVAGWGKTETGRSSSIKLKANLKGVSLANCARLYSQQNINLVSSQICAEGASGVDSCRGDSGGPIVAKSNFNRSNYLYLIGIVSFGSIPCAVEGWPGVYTRVSAYIDWIDDTIKP